MTYRNKEIQASVERQVRDKRVEAVAKRHGRTQEPAIKQNQRDHILRIKRGQD